MKARRNVIASERPPYIYGEILSRSLYYSLASEVPSVGRFLSQGAAVGAMLSFLCPVIGMLSHPENGYNFLLAAYLPVFMGIGILYGVCEGIMIWACTYLAGHRLNLVVRSVIGAVIFVVITFVHGFLFAEPSPYAQKEVSLTDYLFSIGCYAGFGLVFGLATGSKFRPFYELLRGRTDERWLVMNGLTGLFLRVVVTFSLMESVLILILNLQGNFDRKKFTFSVIAVSHFFAAVVIVFARMPFRLLLPLAIVINFPIVALIADVLKPEDVENRTLTISYLVLWAGFLSCRVGVPQTALSFVKKNLAIGEE